MERSITFRTHPINNNNCDFGTCITLANYFAYLDKCYVTD